jgi:Ca2+-binding RTX toxin-like protein
MIGTDELDWFNGSESGDIFYAGAGDDGLFGWGGDDQLYGGDGNDWLLGGIGADLINGGDGIDLADYATSTVTTGVQVNLATGVGAGGEAEGDVLVGIENVYSTYFSDVLTGNATDNQLSGEGGGDVFSGGAGNDLLSGGSGVDTYHFGIGDDHDQVTDWGTEAIETDTVVFGEGIAIDDLWFTQEGNHLRIWVEGTDDWLQINNWYGSGGPKIEEFQSDAGDILLASSVQQLVDAMAVFDPSGSGVLNVPQSAQDEVAPVIAANWS